MQNSGIIKKINKNCITVSMYKETACSHCNNCSDKITNEITFFTDVNVEVGDIVTFEMDDRQVLKAASIVYILPIIFMILGYFLGDKLGLSEAYCILTSFLSLIISFIGIYFYDKNIVKKEMENEITIISITKNNHNNQE